MYSARFMHRLLHIVSETSGQTALKQADKFIDASWKTSRIVAGALYHDYEYTDFLVQRSLSQEVNLNNPSYFNLGGREILGHKSLILWLSSVSMAYMQNFQKIAFLRLLETLSPL